MKNEGVASVPPFVFIDFLFLFSTQEKTHHTLKIQTVN
jgi:hypothetical protein